MIRKAIATDAAAIRTIVDAAYGPLAAKMDKLPGPMLDDYPARITEGVVDVWSEDGRILGMIILVNKPDALMLENVAVSPDAQGKGVGSRLIAHAEAEAKARGYSLIRLYTHITMTTNQAMYSLLGYIETHRGEDEGYHRVQFEKQL